MMKKLLLFLLGACLISNVLAQRPDRTAQEHVKRAVIGGKVVKISENENAFLFYQLSGESGIPVKEHISKLAFVLHEDARIYMVEQVTLDYADDTPAPSIQFLSGEPARLAQLLEMARQPDHHFSLMIRAEGRVLREFALEDFLVYSRRLKQQPEFHPVHISSQVTLLKWPHAKGKGAPEIQPEDLGCTGECDLQFEACAEEACGDPHSLCEPCLQAWFSCRDACPQVCVPTSYVTGSETYSDSCLYIADAHCAPSFYFGGYTIQYYGSCFLTTYTHYHHVNCDGTSYNTTETSYSSVQGQVDSGYSCYPT